MKKTDLLKRVTQTHSHEKIITFANVSGVGIDTACL